MASECFANMHSIPVCTTSVLCAVQIFGLGIENRKVLLDGSRHSLDEMKNLTNYALNPFLPKFDESIAYPDDSPEIRALRNVGQAFRFFSIIQQKYFESLMRRGYSIQDKKQRDDMYSTREGFAPLCRRYVILSAMDGNNPYGLRLNWSAEFNFENEELKRRIGERLDIARRRTENLQNIDHFYNKKGRRLTTPVNVLMQQSKAFLSHLGEAAYLNAAGFCDENHPSVEKGRAKACDNIEKACRHLERLILDCLKCELFTIITYFGKNDRFDETQRIKLLSNAIKARAEDHVPIRCAGSSGKYEICEDTFARHYEIYKNVVESLYEYAEYDPTIRYEKCS